MRTKTAMLFEAPAEWAVREVELSNLGPHDVLVQMQAAGMCHSDDHFATGDLPSAYYPWAGGHEGAGIVMEVGSEVQTVRAGDHVVTLFIPGCGRCRWCATGRQNLCDLGATIMNVDPDNFKMRVDGVGVGQTALVGSFSEYTIVPENSVVSIPKDIPFTSACLVGCGVPTGWGSAANVAEIQPGNTVIVMGVGGIGINAVQGARIVGASNILAVDPAPLKRDTALKVGATEVFESIGAAADRARELTNGQGADASIVTVGVLTGENVAEAFSAVRKDGVVVVTSLSKAEEVGIPVSLMELALYQKRIKGALFGACSPSWDVLNLLDMYKSGDLFLDELVTRTYSLDQINECVKDLRGGNIVRGVITFNHS